VTPRAGWPYGEGFEWHPGEVAVVVEDVITTGGSTREVCEVLKGGRRERAGGWFDH
jgi:orotate phosphoribosyltransferase